MCLEELYLGVMKWHQSFKHFTVSFLVLETLLRCNLLSCGIAFAQLELRLGQRSPIRNLALIKGLGHPPPSHMARCSSKNIFAGSQVQNLFGKLVMFWDGRGKVSYVYEFKKEKKRKKTQNQPVGCFGHSLLVFLMVSLLCPSLTGNDPLLEIIIQVNTWKTFYVWDRSAVRFSL